mmetsp:Transcript_14198/g.18585  ORF Transcript_14198/g.18585 Transcript_14198/m.18585 type:complete len:104 (-) Transcript_14198:756-1067(-)
MISTIKILPNDSLVESTATTIILNDSIRPNNRNTRKTRKLRIIEKLEKLHDMNIVTASNTSQGSFTERCKYVMTFRPNSNVKMKSTILSIAAITSAVIIDISE